MALPHLKHLVWDFDGTLYDTYSQITRAMLYALNLFDCSVPPAEAYALVKQSVFHAVCVYAERFSLPRERLMACFQQFHQQSGRLIPYPGAADCLRRTARLGCKHYLFTHRDRRAIEALKDDDLWVFFTDAITRNMGFADKPAPDALLHLMQVHRFDPEDAYMIGDRALDIQAGHNAGMAGILFDPGGFYPELSTEYRVTALKEIPELMRNIIPPDL